VYGTVSGLKVVPTAFEDSVTSLKRDNRMKAVDLRLRKLLELRTDTPAMVTALEAVADVHVRTCLGRRACVAKSSAATIVRVPQSGKPLSGERARHELRSEVEHRNLNVVLDFIASLQPFEQEVSTLQEAVAELKGICQQVSLYSVL
jgi:hypothetical protein